VEDRQIFETGFIRSSLKSPPKNDTTINAPHRQQLSTDQLDDGLQQLHSAEDLAVQWLVPWLETNYYY